MADEGNKVSLNEVLFKIIEETEGGRFICLPSNRDRSLIIERTKMWDTLKAVFEKETGSKKRIKKLHIYFTLDHSHLEGSFNF